MTKLPSISTHLSSQNGKVGEKRKGGMGELFRGGVKGELFQEDKDRRFTQLASQRNVRTTVRKQ